jgi:hypothetical protein
LLRRVRLPHVPVQSIAAMDSELRLFAQMLPAYRPLAKEAMARWLMATAEEAFVSDLCDNSLGGFGSDCGCYCSTSGMDCVAQEVEGWKERATPRLRYQKIPALDLDHAAGLLCPSQVGRAWTRTW